MVPQPEGWRRGSGRRLDYGYTLFHVWCCPLGASDTAGQNVPVGEGDGAGKKGKVCPRYNISQYGKRGVVKQREKCLIQPIHPQGGLDVKFLDFPSGVETLQGMKWNIGHCIGCTFIGGQNVTRTFRAWTFCHGTRWWIILFHWPMVNIHHPYWTKGIYVLEMGGPAFILEYYGGICL